MSQIITLEVGPEPMIMTAHKTILTRSDYFAKYLENLKEGVQNKVKLPHDVPFDILRILCFLYTGNMFEGDAGDRGRSLNHHWNPQGVTYLIKILIIAEKYCVDDMYWRAMNMLRSVPDKSFDLSHLQQLDDAGLREHSMLGVIMDIFARNATVDPKRLRVMLDNELDLEPVFGLEILKKLTAHLEGQKRHCCDSS